MFTTQSSTDSAETLELPPVVTGRVGGFTLIEVIAVLALLGILAAVVLFFAPRSAAGVVAEADQLASHLRYAQTRALGDIDEWRLQFLNATSYQIERVGGNPVRLPGSQGDTRSLGAGVSISNPPAEIRFDAWGRPVTAGNIPLGSDTTLTLTDGTQDISIVVTAGTGLIR